MGGLAEDAGLERCEEAEDEREETDILGLSRLSKEDEEALEEPPPPRICTIKA